MGPSILKKRKRDDGVKALKSSKARRQNYHSSSSSSAASENESEEDGFTAVDLAGSEIEEPATESEDEERITNGHAKGNGNPTLPDQQTSSASDTDSSQVSSNAASSVRQRSQVKRNDPDRFASSISAILSSKLTSSKRPDPVLARSSTAKEASSSVTNERLEAKARRKLREDKRQALDKGRVKDVLIGTVTGVDEHGENGEGTAMTAAALQEREKRLKKTAQRGVIKLFNAVRAAQVKAEEARAKGGTRDRKEERVQEMSKKGFLDMIAAGGKTSAGKKMEKEIEEA